MVNLRIATPHSQENQRILVFANSSAVQKSYLTTTTLLTLATAVAAEQTVFVPT